MILPSAAVSAIVRFLPVVVTLPCLEDENSLPSLNILTQLHTTLHNLLIESTASKQHKQFLLAHSKNELIQWRGVRRLSVCLSVRL